MPGPDKQIRNCLGILSHSFYLDQCCFCMLCKHGALQIHWGATVELSLNCLRMLGGSFWNRLNSELWVGEDWSVLTGKRSPGFQIMANPSTLGRSYPLNLYCLYELNGSISSVAQLELLPKNFSMAWNMFIARKWTISRSTETQC